MNLYSVFIRWVVTSIVTGFSDLLFNGHRNILPAAGIDMVIEMVINIFITFVVNYML